MYTFIAAIAGKGVVFFIDCCLPLRTYLWV